MVSPIVTTQSPAQPPSPIQVVVQTSGIDAGKNSGSLIKLAQERQNSVLNKKTLSIITSSPGNSHEENNTPTPPAVPPSPSSTNLEVSYIGGHRRSANPSQVGRQMTQIVQFKGTPDESPENSKIGAVVGPLTRHSPNTPNSPSMNGRVVKRKPYCEIIANALIGGASVIGGTIATITSQSWYAVSIPMTGLGLFLFWNARQFKRHEDADELRAKNRYLVKKCAEYLKQAKAEQQAREEFNNVGAEVLLRKNTEAEQQGHQIRDLETQLATSRSRVTALEKSDAGNNEKMLFEARFLAQEIESIAHEQNISLSPEESKGLEDTNNTIIRFKRATKLLSKIAKLIQRNNN